MLQGYSIETPAYTVWFLEFPEQETNAWIALKYTRHSSTDEQFTGHTEQNKQLH
jgi:hypothetical protein